MRMLGVRDLAGGVGRGVAAGRLLDAAKNVQGVNTRHERDPVRFQHPGDGEKWEPRLSIPCLASPIESLTTDTN